MGMVNGVAAVGVWQFYKKLYILSQTGIYTLLGIFTREMKIYVHTKNWTRRFLAELFIIAKTEGRNKTSISGGKDKQCVSFSNNGILHSNEKEQTTDTHYSMDTFQHNYAKWKKLNKKRLCTF